MNAGDVRRFDLQEDIHLNRYELVEDRGGGVWLCRYLEPDDVTLDALCRDYGNAYVDPDADLARALARVGEEFEVRFVSRERWAAAF